MILSLIKKEEKIMRIKRKVPKVVKFFAIAYMIVSMSMGVFSSNCLASNYSDKVFTYSNYNKLVQITEMQTPFEAKEDASSAYAYNWQSNTNISKIYVMGSTVKSNGGGNDYTAGSYKNLPIGSAYYLPNYVYEKLGKSSNGCYASLLMWPAYGDYGMYVKIKWSPDSI